MKNTDSLKKNRDFVRVYQNGRSSADRLMVLYRLNNGTERNRLGISVSRKVGNSVVRHRVKRLIREAYRLEEDLYKTGYDLVCIARAGAKDSTFREVSDSLTHLSRRLRLIKKEPEEGSL